MSRRPSPLQPQGGSGNALRPALGTSPGRGQRPLTLAASQEPPSHLPSPIREHVMRVLTRNPRLLNNLLERGECVGPPYPLVFPTHGRVICLTHAACHELYTF